MSDPVSVVEAVAEGDLRKTLESIAADLARSLVDADMPNKARISKELRETVTALAALPDATEVDAVDELAARRPDSTSPPVPKRAASKRK